MFVRETRPGASISTSSKASARAAGYASARSRSAARTPSTPAASSAFASLARHSDRGGRLDPHRTARTGGRGFEFEPHPFVRAGPVREKWMDPIPPIDGLIISIVGWARRPSLPRTGTSKGLFERRRDLFTEMSLSICRSPRAGTRGRTGPNRRRGPSGMHRDAARQHRRHDGRLVAVALRDRPGVRGGDRGMISAATIGGAGPGLHPRRASVARRRSARWCCSAIPSSS